MPIATDLNTSPYFDDFSISKDYYQVLFKPGIPVQTRELNALQSMLQNQVEQFGDNIFKQGTIISGCNFAFYTVFPYVKVIDTQNNGQPVDVGLYEGALVIGSSSNVTAFIVDTIPGFVATDPDLNTMYLRYTSSGANGSVSSFVNNEILTIYSAANSLFAVSIGSGGTGFSNNDLPVFLSALSVVNSTGGISFINSSASACTFTIGQTITGATSGAKGIITAVNTTINAASVVISVKPQTTDLQASPANTGKWTFQQGEAVNITNGVTGANVNSSVGSGAQAIIITDGSGTIDDISITNKGQGYYIAPYATVASPTGSIGSLTLTAQNFIAQVNVAAVVNSTGTGYAFGVTQGVVFQKGYFLNVPAQIVIVDKYSNTPNNLSVGFSTIESIVNSAVDNALLDNALGSPNYTAPGADRLQLTPTLVVVNTNIAAANANFFPIVQWNSGQPFEQTPQTQYNIIEQEMAQRTFDTAGNFAVDPFLIITQSITPFANETAQFTTTIDPGVAYIDGFKVQTVTNYSQAVNKATTVITANTSVGLYYGNYIRVNNIAGMFLFSSGDVVSLYDTAQNYLANAALFDSAISPTGNILGTARVRSFVYESGGDPGTPTAIYRLYLFDINMNTGGNFRNVLSVYYNNSALNLSAVGDIVTSFSPSTNSFVANLISSNSAARQLVFYAGADALQVANNIQYQYRTITTASANTQGILTFNVPEGVLPYGNSVTLSGGQEQDLIIVPLANGIVSANAPGSVSVNTTVNTVIGTSTSFLTTFTTGDYLGVYHSGGAIKYARITNIANNTYMNVDSPFLVTNTSANCTLAFLQNIPISTASRANRTANTNSGATTLTINLGNTLTGSVNCAVAYNIQLSNVQPIAKTTARNTYVKLNLATVGINGAGATANTTGPWLLGVPDIFRLKNVYLDTSSSVSNTSLDVTTNFYIDHNQNGDFYNLGYLYLNPTANLALSSSNYLLVVFDAYKKGSTNGMFTVGSYSINDTLALANLNGSSTYVNTLEIPEFYDSYGNYHDLRDNFDFRPYETNTVVYATSSGSANINPVLPNPATKFGNTASLSNNKKFPVPSSTLYSQITYYQPVFDLVTVNANGNFNILTGANSIGGGVSIPQDSIILGQINIPPYPSLPQILSATEAVIGDTKIATQTGPYIRQHKYAITVPQPSALQSQQPHGYTMQAIGTLDQRITNLEYYMNLTLQQISISNIVIPSSVDAQLNRFKYGFFADNFQNLNFSNINDPEYNATIVDKQLTAKINQLNLPLKFGANTKSTGRMALLPFQNYALIQQLNATNGPVKQVSNTITQNTVVQNTVVTQSRVCVVVQNITGQYDTIGDTIEIASFALSNTNGPVDVYFDFYSGIESIEVYQSGSSNFQYSPGLTPLTNTASAALLTSGERSNLSSNGATSVPSGTGGTDWTSGNRPDFTPFPAPSNSEITHAGHLSWTHIANNGLYYNIVTTKYAPNYGYYICFPTDANTQPVINTSIISLAPTTYTGTFTTVNPPTFPIVNKVSQQVKVVFGGATQENYSAVQTGPGLFTFYESGDYSQTLTSSQVQALYGKQVADVNYPSGSSFSSAIIAGDQSFGVTINGLKPNTLHIFKFFGQDQTAMCTPINGTRGGALISGPDGSLQFSYLYTSSILSSIIQQQASVTSWSAFLAYFNAIDKIVGSEQMSVTNSDGTSTAITYVTAVDPFFIGNGKR